MVKVIYNDKLVFVELVYEKRQKETVALKCYNNTTVGGGISCKDACILGLPV